jgi:cellulose synthase/poly-beta-1,6-N-acetylglucosamine synthase-like glycosyltransferase
LLDLVSLVICTADRSKSLEKTLQSLEKITYKNFEVIIIDASSTKETIEMLGKLSSSFSFKMQWDTLDKKNISCSRNLGISLALGSIIAFLDDDAIPPPNWIEQLLATYLANGEKCAGVGGAVRDMTRTSYPLQFSRGISNVFSETIHIRDSKAFDYNNPQGFWYNSLMGANSSYRREALEKIKGYDEFFEYFLDETDVCLRLINAGYEIHYSDVVVEHYPQPSHNRKDQKHLTCWYALAKNTTYFALKHGYKKVFFPILIARLVLVLIFRCILRIIRLKFTHNLPNSILFKYIQEAIEGLRMGWQAGLGLHKAKSI